MFAVPSSFRRALAAAALALSLLAVPAVAAADHVEVLAITASSADGMLMDAVDGSLDTAWRNKRDGEREAWLAVRFEAATRLRGLRLHTGALPAGTYFDVETSLDGDRYQTQLRDQRPGANGAVEVSLPKSPQALYLRVRFHHAGPGRAPQYQVLELEALPAK